MFLPDFPAAHARIHGPSPARQSTLKVSDAVKHAEQQVATPMLSCGGNAYGVLWCAILGAGGMRCDFGQCRAQADHLAHQALDGAHRAADRAAAEGGRVAGELVRCVWLAGWQQETLLGPGERVEEMMVENAARLIARCCFFSALAEPQTEGEIIQERLEYERTHDTSAPKWRLGMSRLAPPVDRAVLSLIIILSRPHPCERT